MNAFYFIGCLADNPQAALKKLQDFITNKAMIMRPPGLEDVIADELLSATFMGDLVKEGVVVTTTNPITGELEIQLTAHGRQLERAKLS